MDNPPRPLELTRVTPGEPIFVQMPPLPVGLHTMRVDAAVVGDTNTENLGHLNVAMSVREAPHWHHGVDPAGPLSVRVDPVIPTLEELWDGQIDIEVLGPRGRAVKCDTSLLHRGKEKPAVRIVRRLELPITPNKWTHHFENNFRTKKEVQRRYDAAYACRVHFDADELGTFELLCEREFAPLRWALVGKRNRKPVVQLIDDSGRAEVPRVSHYTLENPAAEAVSRLRLGIRDVCARRALSCQPRKFLRGYHSRAAKVSVFRGLDEFSGHPKPTKISADRHGSCGSGPQVGQRTVFRGHPLRYKSPQDASGDHPARCRTHRW